jgi:hypothetical protein
MTRQEESLKMLIMNRNFKRGGRPDLCYHERLQLELLGHRIEALTALAELLFTYQSSVGMVFRWLPTSRQGEPQWLWTKRKKGSLKMLTMNMTLHFRRMGLMDMQCKREWPRHEPLDHHQID